MEYAIGTQFIAGGKVKRQYIVKDVLKTYNATGELVSIRYVATHEFMGQLVTDRDVCAVTIAKGLVAPAALPESAFPVPTEPAEVGME